MRYVTLKNKNKNHIEAIPLTGGINTAVRSDKTLENQFVSGINLTLNNSTLETRKGLSPITSTIIGNYDIYGDMEKSMEISEYQLYLGGKNGRICYNIWGDESTYQKLYIYFLGNDGNLSSLGNITVNRVDSETFFRIKNVLFICGAAKNGDGIYCFISQLNEDDPLGDVNGYSIYEHNPQNNTWTKLDNNDYYTPIIYMNGRGTRYDEAAELTTVFEGKPTYPEAQNLLGGRFMAFFTSDAYSSDFVLPIQNLDPNISIVCQVYRNDSEKCTFTIPYGASSVTTSFFGISVTLTVNRQTGHFSFTSGASAFPPPKTPSLKGNNIQITAIKLPEQGYDKIIGSKGSVCFGSRNYLYGNSISKNEIYASKMENPLYFPATMKTAVGNTYSPITTLKLLDDNLIALKEEGVFKISVLSETKSQSIDIPLGISREYVGPDTLKSTAICLENGSINEKASKVCDNILVWLCKNKSVYALIGNKIVSLVSKPIESILSGFTNNQLNNAFAVYSDGKYMLFIGNTVLVLNLKGESEEYKHENILYSNFSKNISWYRYILPQSTKYLFAQNTSDGLRIFCSNMIKNYNYISSLSAQKDIELDFSTPTPTQKETEIEFTLLSRSFDFGSPTKYKEIRSISFDMGGNGTYSIDVGDSYNESTQHVKLSSVPNTVVKILPFLPPIKNVWYSIRGKAPFNISLATFEYKLKG